MKVWILKAIIQKSISYLPFAQRINFLFQKYVTGGVRLTEALFTDKLTHCNRHITYFQKYAPGAQNFTALELGTGWYPIVPVGLFLAGADKIYTIDISPLMNRERILQTIQQYVTRAESGLPFKADEKRLEILKNLLVHSKLTEEQLLQQLNITSLICDARRTPLPDGSIDLINSNNTFEHIYPDILVDILKEFTRLLKAGGVMSHAIDMSDHFAHLDRSITPYNFLQYTGAQWQRIDNSIQPQNRMRVYEYEELYRKNSIPITEKVITGAGYDSINTAPLDARFKGHPLEETRVLHVSLITKG